jgi:hypothetical protein
MKRNPIAIAVGGEQRLRQAIEAEVRREHQAELDAAVGWWQKCAIKAKIRGKIKRRIENVASPYSLWHAS